MSTIVVGSSSALMAALKTAKAGDVVQLKAGDYTSFAASGLKFGGAGVTITSADPAHEARFSGFSVNGSEGLKIQNIEVVVDPKTSVGITVQNSTNITLEGLDVHGSLDGNSANDASGMLIRDSKNVTLKNSEFHELATGVTHSNSTGVNIVANQFHTIRMDGVRGGGSSEVAIKNNYFTDFSPAKGDHPDAIQFWTRNTTTAAHDIIVSGNVIVRGAGQPMQGVFIKDEVGSLHYTNVTISDNLIVGGAFNGISVDGGKNITIKDNTVAGLADQGSWIGLRAISGVTLTNNKATSYNFATNVTGVTEVNDARIAAPTDGGRAIQAAYYDAHHSADAMVGAQSLSSSRLVGSVAGDVAPVTMAEFNAQADLVQHAIDAFRMNTKYVTGTSGVDNLGVDGARNTAVQAGAGNDILNGGGVGDNTLAGGTGDDLYRVTSLRDTVSETANEGYDHVMTAVDHTLAANVERLTLTGNARVGVGNELGNWISGSAADESLSGLAGDDNIFGGAGNDLLEGGDGADKLAGDAGADKLLGGAGADTLDGADGVDILTGGGGADRFIFRMLDKTPDTVTDFTRAEGDKIDLSIIDASTIGARNEAFTFIGVQAFHKMAGELRYEVSAGDSYVMGDVNGDGLADFKVLVKGVTTLMSADFIL